MSSLFNMSLYCSLQAIFDQICQLRERRLDLEEALFETKKACDGTKKELDALVKKGKVIDSALKNAASDLEAFQVRLVHLKEYGSM